MNLVIYGNCQALILGNILRDANPEASIAMFEGWKIAPEEMDGYETAVRNANVIWCQPVQRHYRDDDRLSTFWIKQNAPAGCQVVVFPVVFWRGYFPYMHSFHSIMEVDGLSHNVHFIEMFCSGASAQEIVDTCLQPDFLPTAFVVSEAEDSLRELERREAVDGINVRISDVIRQHASGRHLLKTFNHPNRFLSTQLLQRLLAASGMTADVCADGSDHVSAYEFPILPAVARSLHLSSAIPVSRVIGMQGPLLLADYVARLVAVYDASYQDHAALRRALTQHAGAQAYLDRFHQATQGVG